MKRPTVGRKAIVAYVAAAIVGFALGSYRYVEFGSDARPDEAAVRTSEPARRNPPQSQQTSIEASHVRASTTDRWRDEPAADDNAEAEGLVFAAAGLVLRPAKTSDRFIGFLVVRNDSDRRFSVGDVIVSVNDQPVENSAAGSELLIAALADPDAHVEVRAARD